MGPYKLVSDQVYSLWANQPSEPPLWHVESALNGYYSLSVPEVEDYKLDTEGYKYPNSPLYLSGIAPIYPDHQQFILFPQSGVLPLGKYTITNRASFLPLQAMDTSNGGAVRQQQATAEPNQQWYVSSASLPYTNTMVNMWSGKALDKSSSTPVARLSISGNI